MRIDCSRFTLRPFAPGDAPDIAAAINVPEIVEQMRSLPFPYTLNDAEQFIENVTTAEGRHIFAIEIDGVAQGSIGLTVQPEIYKLNAEIGYWLAKPHWGRGIMTEAIVSLTRFGFQQVGLWRIFAGIYSSNPASMRVLEKAGYTHRLTNRQNIVKSGRRLDECLFDAYADTWQPTSPSG